MPVERLVGEASQLLVGEDVAAELLVPALGHRNTFDFRRYIRLGFVSAGEGNGCN